VTTEAEEKRRAGRESPEARRALWLLAIGAGAGLLLAAVGLLLPGGEAGEAVLPPTAVALVNGKPVRRADFERLIAGVASDSRNPIDDEMREHVLNRMIEEELLVQRGLELGLAQVDRRVRGDLTASLIQSVVSSAEDREPEPGELRGFYAENSEFFTLPGRLRVRQVFFRAGPVADEDEVRSRAESAREELLAGRDFETVRRELGDREISLVPDGLLPPTKLREYVGPTALKAAQALEPGELSPVVRSGVGFHILQLVDVQRARTPDFEEVESQVRSEWRRRTGDDALRLYLDELRASSDVVVALD
jgi:parvulin-like peptidyl-prolyl isomerase